jgi:6-phosphogluconolactonase (cycloisomerase 2 family)
MRRTYEVIVMPTQKNSRIWDSAFLAITCSFASLGVTTPISAAEGAVYTMTNAAAGNSVVMYSRSADGTISAPAFVPTGGAGTGGGLGSQGALALSDDGRWLLAVNTGSNDVTVFAVGNSGLTITDREPSGGMMPISIALNKDMVVVLNAGGAANITAFRLSPHGALIPMPGSTRVLPGLAPAQVSFAAHGSLLIVTQKTSNTIVVYKVEDDGVSGPFSHASAGQTPFGFGISKMDILIVSEAAGGAPGASTISSYEVDDSGQFHVITSALHAGQTAACWVAVTQNGKYAYIANTGSSTISSVAVGRDGTLRVLSAVAGETPPSTAAIDLAFNVNSKYLYALASGTISTFRASADGSLTRAQVVSGLPLSTAGLVAR